MYLYKYNKYKNRYINYKNQSGGNISLLTLYLKNIPLENIYFIMVPNYPEILPANNNEQLSERYISTLQNNLTIFKSDLNKIINYMTYIIETLLIQLKSIIPSELSHYFLSKIEDIEINGKKYKTKITTIVNMDNTEVIIDKLNQRNTNISINNDIIEINRFLTSTKDKYDNLIDEAKDIAIEYARLNISFFNYLKQINNSSTKECIEKIENSILSINVSAKLLEDFIEFINAINSILPYNPNYVTPDINATSNIIQCINEYKNELYPDMIEYLLNIIEPYKVTLETRNTSMIRETKKYTDYMKVVQSHIIELNNNITSYYTNNYSSEHKIIYLKNLRTAQKNYYTTANIMNTQIMIAYKRFINST